MYLFIFNNLVHLVNYEVWFFFHFYILKGYTKVNVWGTGGPLNKFVHLCTKEKYALPRSVTKHSSEKAPPRANASPLRDLASPPAVLAAAADFGGSFSRKKKKKNSQDGKQAKNLIIHGYLDYIKNNHFMK